LQKKIGKREHRRISATNNFFTILKLILFSCFLFMMFCFSGHKMNGGWTGISVADALEPDPLPPILPRWREGGTPYNPEQSLQPFTLSSQKPLRTLQNEKKSASPGSLASPPEYEPVRGILIPFFWQVTPEVVKDCVVALTKDPKHDEIAYVLVTDTWQKMLATSVFEAGGADMNKVQFIMAEANSIWMRDYGPHFIWLDGAMGIADSHYYPGRPEDNFIPSVLGDEHFLLPTFDMGLYHSGGNFQAGPNRSGFVTSLISEDNPISEGFNQTFIDQLFYQYQGIDVLHVMPMLPPFVDGTGHIDMWMYLVDEDSVLISEFVPGSDPTAVSITDNAVPYMENLGFEVHRLPAWNEPTRNGGNIHYTYTNGFRVNDRILIPSYGEGNPDYLDEDAEALAAWQAAAGPDVEIIPINSYSIIPLAGALHCIVKQVPRYTQPFPSGHVIEPKAGKLLVSGTEATIEWSTTDTNNRTIPQIDLYYSVDGGITYEHISTTGDTGYFRWRVPSVSTIEAKIKVVATTADLEEAEFVSSGVFEIAPAKQTVYDFTTYGGMDKLGLGYQTRNWSFLDGNRTPLNHEIQLLFKRAYDKLAYSDGTRGDYDLHRYRSPLPGKRNSTHIFEFSIYEDPAGIDDIDIVWEGYADWCTQVELYVWDYLEEQWGDGSGLYGQNRFMDNWAGNRDGVLGGNIRSDFERYIDSSGQMTFLLYAERHLDRTFHDYMAVTVSQVQDTED
jgi:agmatine/peptidylarginine deiminase